MKRAKWLVLLAIAVLPSQVWAQAPPGATSFSSPVADYHIDGFDFNVNWFSSQPCKHAVVKRHCGVDLNARKTNEPVYASGDGIVRWAGPYSFKDPRWANLVMLDHSVPGVGNVTTVYGHIEIAANVRVGKILPKGALLGRISGALSKYGETPHLHFGVRVSSYSEQISRRGALPQCASTESDPQFPGGFVDPTAFLRDHASTGNPGPVVGAESAPQVTVDNLGRLVVLVRASNGEIWACQQSLANGGWARWLNLRGNLAGDPIPCLNGQGRIEFFVRGTDNHIYCRWQTSPGGLWSTWYSDLGGNVPSNPAVSNNADGRLQMFVRGFDNRMYTMWQQQVEGNWSGWSDFGGGSWTWDPVSIRNRSGHQELFTRASDGSIWSKYQWELNGAWTEWLAKGGNVAGRPTVSANSDGRLQVFVRGGDRNIYTKFHVNAAGDWSGWFFVGNSIQADGDPAVALDRDGKLQVFVRGVDGAIYKSIQTAMGFTAWSSMGGVLSNNPSVGRNADGRLEIFARGTDGRLYHRWQRADPSQDWAYWEELRP